ncbi:unnamed protein product, partial [Ectocarpus sp. 4 AP-2014]
PPPALTPHAFELASKQRKAQPLSIAHAVRKTPKHTAKMFRPMQVLILALVACASTAFVVPAWTAMRPAAASGRPLSALNMAAGVAMPEIKTAGPSIGVLDKKEVSFETSIRPEDKVKIFMVASPSLPPSLTRSLRSSIYLAPRAVVKHRTGYGTSSHLCSIFSRGLASRVGCVFSESRYPPS